MMATTRLRLPAGYRAFKPDFGEIVRKRRQGLFTQKQLADAIGITRPSLSAIENGHAKPLPLTLDDLMHELDLDPVDVFERGRTARTPRFTDSTPRAAHRLDMGRCLRDGRKRAKLALHEVAAMCGMSVSQLSRLERGQLLRSSAYEDDPDDAQRDEECRILTFEHPKLRELYAQGS